MKLTHAFGEKPVFSFEIFPPKPTSDVSTVFRALAELQDLRPDFISVTYGAGGSVPGSSTCEIVSRIKREYGIESVAHLPCINSTRDEIRGKLQEFQAAGVENILALRGDRNPELTPKEEFRYACELVELIREETGDAFDICGACYPEGHPECDSMAQDLRHLKEKVDAGVSHLITQLFFDNELFYRFLEKAEIAGINVPIEAGIMPVTNRRQIERMVSLCGASLPAKFTKMMQRYEHSPEAMRDAGIAYAIDQIVDLAANGVDGIHLYTMNNPYVARKITAAVHSVLGR